MRLPRTHYSNVESSSACGTKQGCTKGRTIAVSCHIDGLASQTKERHQGLATRRSKRMWTIRSSRRDQTSSSMSPQSRTTLLRQRVDRILGPSTPNFQLVARRTGVPRQTPRVGHPASTTNSLCVQQHSQIAPFHRICNKVCLTGADNSSSILVLTYVCSPACTNPTANGVDRKPSIKPMDGGLSPRTSPITETSLGSATR